MKILCMLRGKQTVDGNSANKDNNTHHTQPSSPRVELNTILINGIILDSGFISLPAASLDHPLGLLFRVFPFIKQLMYVVI